MVKTYESRFPPSPDLDKVTVSFEKLNNTDLFPSTHVTDKVEDFVEVLSYALFSLHSYAL